MKRWFDWFFRDRRDGAIVIAQWPNLPLGLFGLIAAIEWAAAPTGLTGSILHGAGRLCLAAWSLDEVVRGVNPWRRCLGAAVFAAMLWRFATAG